MRCGAGRQPPVQALGDALHELAAAGLGRRQFAVVLLFRNRPRLEGVVRFGDGGFNGLPVGHAAGQDRAEMQPLDSFGFGSVSLLKIDVEGFEDEVLAGAERLISALSRGER